MASNNQGGPWGGSGPGGGNGGNNPWGRRGPRGGNQPPDIDDLLRQGQDHLRRMLPGGFGSGRGTVLVVLAVLAAWMLTGLYRVNPDEQGVELLFGRYVKTTGPGLNYWFPAPLGEVVTPRVTETRQISIGSRESARSILAPRDTARGELAAATSQMLTGDQNIIDLDFIVQWRIREAGEFLFNIRDPEQTVRAAAESAMREVVGQTPLETAMTTGRAEIQSRSRELLQSILDSYHAGITILDVKLQKADPPQDVIDAFNDVQRARQDKERLQNEAQAYKNDIIPRAKGEAERMQQEASAYRDRVVKDAEGESARFLSVYETYRNARTVTTERLYLEAMQDVLKNSDKILLGHGNAAGSGVVPYLPLPELKRTERAAGQEKAR
ncbi:FtsH protease activity modulator HflK [Haematospirillum jordaniae]|uniref:Protein HflK n=1 Tax=Haematospirillum jordaniae TaxID=1549855 RepID=A0A143DBK8_9PROT|nr:FtsH protease activity modulator HflK [Haematospirillum jordaniae]AMW34105.1 HflK protein [Haematospirillum jordaniae]NKD45253.1 FtsH protease activity modulator HflK [Haematospirillum jordaniae]NKD57245.1 FtsH protease activity modulator HflK [Haematospirillum jordaniae]NKD59599.1 FtsH protease activity modulator HflK [Haematospirillum jordaniae]NKD67171.1 FtsH protease activity modulator HflK [Haematospirillum jordaniae]